MEIAHIRKNYIQRARPREEINEKHKKTRVLQNIFNCHGHIFITRLYGYIFRFCRFYEIVYILLMF